MRITNCAAFTGLYNNTNQSVFSVAPTAVIGQRAFGYVSWAELSFKMQKPKFQVGGEKNDLFKPTDLIEVEPLFVPRLNKLLLALSLARKMMTEDAQNLKVSLQQFINA